MVQEKDWVVASLKNETIDSRYESIGGFTHGFDYMRFILAAAVVIQHSIRSSYGQAFADPFTWGGWHRTLAAPILLMFFALSGFLVAGSLKRRPTATAFITLRGIRLVPALAVEVLLSALILGPVFTSLPLGQYFDASSFHEYFGNIVGRIRFVLPGVFETNPATDVNVSLWTVPYELECYLVLLGLWLFRVLNSRALVAVFTAGFIAFYTRRELSGFDPVAAVEGIAPRALIAAFLCGLCVSLYSDKIRLSIPIFVAMLAGMIATTLSYRTVFIAPIFAAYIVVYLGMTHPPKKTFLMRGDYSYGLYLFAYPIQQTYTHLFPAYRHWYLNAVFTLVVGVAYAAFSWWFIEKPILGRKKQIVSAVENVVSHVKNTFTPARLYK